MPPYCIAKGADYFCAVPSPPQTLRNTDNVCAIYHAYAQFRRCGSAFFEVVVRNGLSQYVMSETTSNRYDNANLRFFLVIFRRKHKKISFMDKKRFNKK